MPVGDTDIVFSCLMLIPSREVFLPFKLCKNQLQLSQFDFIQKREENAVLYIAYKIG